MQKTERKKTASSHNFIHATEQSCTGIPWSSATGNPVHILWFHTHEYFHLDQTH